MVALVPPVTVMFGGKPNVKAQKSNPSKAKVVMSPAPTVGGSLDSYKEPTHQERMHRAAADEHVHATRKYVAGEMTKGAYEKVKSRAAGVMAKTPKSRR